MFVSELDDGFGLVILTFKATATGLRDAIMDIKQNALHNSDTNSDEVPNEKSTPLHIDDIPALRNGSISKAEKMQAVDELIARPDVTLESFAHLDIKKILRKIDLRLIPMLTLLCLLSFLDRGNIGRQPDINRTSSRTNKSQEMQRSKAWPRT